ncbi:MAG: hypothetical protein V4558_09685 [Gemmatimonadota bacterium]
MPRALLRSLAVIAASVLLPGCGTIADAGPSGTFAISVPDPWPGAEVRVTSADFRHTTGTAVLKADTFTVNLARVSDTVMSGKLPAAATGQLSVSLDVDGYHFLLPAISIAGFADGGVYADPGMSLWTEPYQWTGDNTAAIYGMNILGYPVIVELETGTTRSIGPPGRAYPQTGPGPTYLPGTVLYLPPGGVLESWVTTPVPTKIAEHPEIGWLKDDIWYYNRAQFGPNTWFIGDDRGTWILRTDGTKLVDWKEDLGTVAWGIHFSPRGDRATISGYGSAPGIPVYSLPSGDVAFRAPTRNAQGVDFSPDGTVLALLGARTPPAFQDNHLLLFDATSGAVLKDTSLAGFALGLRMDRVRPVLYVAQIDTVSSEVSILVFRRAPFELLGRMRAPAPGMRPFYPGMALSGRRGLYLYDELSRRFWRFTLPTVQ